ncbi:hypothetical protein AA80_08540 [Petrotoga sibirica DSM 13575]|uniref:Uncharacterized protein n=1 Tax=Petrotoga sibirica DSM 13575 TaxID=1122956 RepID=A0A855MKT6_9BACT|nr:hypothetical protein AA80_08540 [Petrotoga sibirica DSM 13575]POZ90194.1 hypothetical protein AD60_08670 [Petrotoga sp. SL27]
MLSEKEFEMIEFLIMCFYDGETMKTLFETYESLKKYKKKKSLFIYSRYFATPFLGTKFNENLCEKGVILSNNLEYKHAIFLNFIPYSFLNSSLENFRVNGKTLSIQLLFSQIDYVIHKNEVATLLDKINTEKFAKIFNEVAENRGIIQDLCDRILCINNYTCCLESIYEYVGRMIEFAVAKGAIKYKNENPIL